MCTQLFHIRGRRIFFVMSSCVLPQLLERYADGIRIPFLLWPVVFFKMSCMQNLFTILLWYHEKGSRKIWHSHHVLCVPPLPNQPHCGWDSFAQKRKRCFMIKCFNAERSNILDYIFSTFLCSCQYFTVVHFLPVAVLWSEGKDIVEGRHKSFFFCFSFVTFTLQSISFSFT